MTHCILIGAPLDEGQRRPGCLMGPAAYRGAGLPGTLTALGHTVQDRGDVLPGALPDLCCANPAVHHLPEMIAWTDALRDAVAGALPDGLPIIMGGDHALALGSVAGAAIHAHATGRPLFVLWLDAHSDIHTVQAIEPTKATRVSDTAGASASWGATRLQRTGIPLLPAS